MLFRSQMEATGYQFRNAQGEPDDALRILKDHGIDTIRLRTWVNPSEHRTDGHNSKEETVAMAVRAQRMGMRVMINFHYSDSWADPQQQNKPAAWAGHDFPRLLQDVYSYTWDVMKALKAAGYKVAASYAGNDAAAEKFKAETGIPVYKWDVSLRRLRRRHQESRGRSWAR